MGTLHVNNRAQAIIFVCEMQGQISDGRWENSQPAGHWKVPCNANVVVNPEKQGRNFRHMRGYNFGEKELFSIVGSRMTRAVRVGLAFPEIPLSVLEEHHWNFETPLTNPPSWWKPEDKRLEKVLKAFGVATAQEFENKVDNVCYFEKDCHKDCSALTSCFRKYDASLPEIEEIKPAPVIIETNEDEGIQFGP